MDRFFVKSDGQYVVAVGGNRRAEDYGPDAVEVPERPGPGWVWRNGEWIDETPPPPPPSLSPPQFEYLLAVSGFGDVWEAVQAGAKASGDMQTYATLRAERARSRYELDRTLGMIAALDRVIAAAAPDADVSEATITAAWMQAAEFKGAAG